MTTLTKPYEFELLTAAEIVARVLEESSGVPCVTCSFQLEDVVVLDLVRRHVPSVAVLFLDTGYHFAATYEYRDRLAHVWKLNMVNVVPEMSVVEQEASFGVLNRSDPGKCCEIRKVEPLMRALKPFDIWFTGLRREQSPSRVNLKVVETHELSTGKALAKVSPLAGWRWPRVWEYAIEHGIEHLSLYDDGYRSIGCEPCTSIPAEGADPRSGRWGGTKLECGIHTFSKRVK